MALPLAVSPFIAGDPIRLRPEIGSFAGLVAALAVLFLIRMDAIERFGRDGDGPASC